MRLLVATLFAGASSLVCGGHPADRVPPGYADACWGGRDNYPRYIAFSDRRLVVSMPVEQNDWDKLAGIFMEVAAKHGLEIFDSSVAGPNLNAMTIEACHPSGILLRVDERIWANPRLFDQAPGNVEVALYTYRPEARFDALEDTLVTRLQAIWKNAKVERFSVLPPSKKALPDAVRHLLVQECAEANAPKPDYCEGL